jgi:hypothetical protein
MKTGGQHRFFFIHVMKTGGSTFVQHIHSNFGPDEVYPDPRLDPDVRKARTSIAYLRGLPPERLARIRIFRGHFPFVVTELLGFDFVTLSVLRDPVERTLSYLRRRRELRDEHRSLDEIYEDPLLFPRFIHNHQTKMFALTREDDLETFFRVTEIDERRLRIAKGNLEKVDVLGLQEQFDDFLAELADRYGWRFTKRAKRHRSREMDVSDSFRRRIADDNALDVELYDHARRLCEERRKKGRAAPGPARKERVKA